MATEMDDSELVGVLSARLTEKEQLKAEKTKLEYELERLKDATKTNNALLDKLRQKAYWQNNMEMVELIDKERANVNV